MMPHADPEKGAGVRTPALWKITNSIGLYRKYAIGPPSPWEKFDPLEMLDRPSPWNIGKYIVFFEKAMITGLPLQNKMRILQKKKKKNVRAFFQSVGLGPPPPRPPPPPTAKPDEKFPGSHVSLKHYLTFIQSVN